MPNPTEKTLNALLSSSLRIEKMMEKKEKDKGDAGDVEKLVSGVSTDFANISKSLEKVAEQATKTNVLLEKILGNNEEVEGQSLALVSDSAKAFEKLGSAWGPLLDAIVDSGDVTDKEIDGFKKILMTLAFVDHKTGDPLVEEKQLKAATDAISSLKVITQSILLLGLGMVLFSFMIPQIMKGSLAVVMIVAVMAVALIGMQKALQLTGTEKDPKDATGPVNSLFQLGKAIAIFGLVMAGFSFIVPQILGGIVPFLAVLAMVSIALMMMHATTATEGLVDMSMKDNSPIGSLMRLAKAIAIFGIMMVGFSFLIPQILKGLIAFTLVLGGVALAIMIVHLAFKITGMDFNPLKDSSPLGTLAKLAQSIALFALTFVIVSYVAKQFAIGALVVTLVVGAIAVAILLMHQMLGGSKFKIGKMGSGPMDSMWKLAKSVAVFSLIFIGLYYFQKQFAVGGLMVLLMLAGLTIGMLALSIKPVRKGSRNLRHLSISLLIMIGALTVFALLVQPKLGWEGLGMLAATIGVLSLIGLLLGIPPIDGWVKAGAMNLILLGGALTVFAIGLAIYAQLAAPKLTWESIGMMGAVIGVMALIGTLVGIPPIVGFVMAGAVALIALGGALTIFAVGLSIYAAGAAGKMKLADVAVLSAMIGAMALIGTVVGIVSPLVILGSGAMIVAGGALILISTGLAIFAAIKWKKKDGSMLSNALSSLVDGFMGGPMPGGIFAAIKFAVKAAARAVLMLVTIPPFILAGAALIPIAAGLAIFKRTKWTKKDSSSLNAALYGIVNGFVTALDGVNWYTLWWGVRSMKDVGNVLVSLAEGVQAFASLTFKEYTYDEESKSMKVSAIKKLTPKDIALTGIAIGMVISAVTKPLAEFGEMMMGGGGDGFLGVNWGKLIAINFGIQSLGTIGKGLVELAAGVQDWANMTVTEYGIGVNKETGLNELMPIAKRPITNGEIQSAMVNISDVLSAMAVPLSEFGSWFTTEQKGWFGSTYQAENKGLKLGISSLAQIGGGLVQVANAVVKWANMEYTEMGIGVNKETGVNELMPIATRKIGKADINQAKHSIGSVLAGLVYPLTSFGEMFTTTQKGWFGSTYQVENKALKTGISQMGAIADGLSKIADMMVKWANMEYTEMEVYKDKDGQTKLQPKAVKKIGFARLMMARFNIGLTLSTIGQAFMDYLRDTATNGGPSGVQSLVKELVIQQEGLAKVAKYIMPWSDPKLTFSAQMFYLWVWKARPLHTIGKAYVHYKNITKSQGGVTGVTNLVEQMDVSMKGMISVAWQVFWTWGARNQILPALNFKIWMYTMSYPFMVKFMNTLSRFGRVTKGFEKNFRGFTKIPQMFAMTVFTKNMITLARHASRMERFANSFERIAASMGVFAKNFKLMDRDGISAFQTWTETLVTAVEVANDPGFFENVLTKAGEVIETGFEVGQELFGDKDKDGKLTDEKKKNIIEKTQEATKDNEVAKLVSAVSQLQAEISGLKAALGGTMNVNVQTVSSTASIKVKGGGAGGISEGPQ